MPYYRLTRANVIHSNADAFIEFFENVKPQLQAIPGFIAGNIIRTNHPDDDDTLGFLRSRGDPDEDQMIAIAQYDSKASADGAQELIRNVILPAMATFTTGDLVIREGESLWSLY